MLAFEPLAEEVRQVRLVLKDFVLKFDASDQPIETVDIVAEFDQQIERKAVQQVTAAP